MKKYIIILSGIIVLVVTYYFTGSWILSLIILAALVIYLSWVIGFELGMRNPDLRKERKQKMHEQSTKEHQEKTKDNPTLR